MPSRVPLGGVYRAQGLGGVAAGTGVLTATFGVVFAAGTPAWLEAYRNVPLVR